jgi:hypothetical protein
MPDSIEPVIETGVDELVRLLKSHDKLPVAEAAKILRVSPDVVQSWVDFLVEEKILGVEYKFTVPYIFLNQVQSTLGIVEQKAIKTLQDFKNEFNERVESTLPQMKGRVLVLNMWQQHVRQELERKRAWFLAEARKRSLPEPEKLWMQYSTTVLNA